MTQPSATKCIEVGPGRGIEHVGRADDAVDAPVVHRHAAQRAALRRVDEDPHTRARAADQIGNGACQQFEELVAINLAAVEAAADLLDVLDIGHGWILGRFHTPKTLQGLAGSP
ncbi:MAG: hypothetical protein QM722_12500 [Piscinibacter sp.]